MSRSYKHTPRCGDKKDRFMKNYANRRLRRLKSECLLQHNSYKKNFCSWEICDYESVGTSFEEYWRATLSTWRRWQKDEPYPNREEEYRRWYKWNKMK